MYCRLLLACSRMVLNNLMRIRTCINDTVERFNLLNLCNVFRMFSSPCFVDGDVTNYLNLEAHTRFGVIVRVKISHTQ